MLGLNSNAKPLFLNSSSGYLSVTLNCLLLDAMDVKFEDCLSFILECLHHHRESYLGDSEAPPFFLGLNGVQGAGKTVLVSLLSWI